MSKNAEVTGGKKRRSERLARLDDIVSGGSIPDLEAALLSDAESIAGDFGALAEACRLGHAASIRALLRDGRAVGGSTYHADAEPPVLWALASGSEEAVAELCGRGAVDDLAREWIEPCCEAAVAAKRNWQGNPLVPFLVALDRRCRLERDLRFSGGGLASAVNACRRRARAESARPELMALLRRLEDRIDRIESLVFEACEHPDSVESLERRILGLRDEDRRSAMSLLLPRLATYGLRFENTRFGKRIQREGHRPEEAAMVQGIRNRHALLQWLLGFSFDVNARDDLGRTALIYAAWNGDSELWSWLVERNANPSLTSIDRGKEQTLIDWARMGSAGKKFVPLCEEYLRNWVRMSGGAEE